MDEGTYFKLYPEKEYYYRAETDETCIKTNLNNGYNIINCLLENYL